MAGTLPLGHVGANLADHLQGRVRVHAVNPGQVHPRHLIQVGPDVEARRVPLMGLFTIGSRRFAVAAVLKPFQLGFNLPVALGNLILIHPVQLQGLGQLEDMFLPPVPLQRLGDGRLVRLDPIIAQLRQLTRIPLAAHDGLDDVHAGLAGDVADDVLELHVHLGQRLLHMLDMVGRVFHQHRSLAQVATQASDLPVGPEGARQQSVGVQLLQPLAVQHVGLAPGHVLDAPGVHQHHRKAPFFQHAEQRYPVHPRRLHDHGLHAALGQPLRQAIQVRCEGGKLLYRLLRTVGGHRDEMAGGAHVDARRIQVQLG